MVYSRSSAVPHPPFLRGYTGSAKVLIRPREHVLLLLSIMVVNVKKTIVHLSVRGGVVDCLLALFSTPIPLWGQFSLEFE